MNLKPFGLALAVVAGLGGSVSAQPADMRSAIEPLVGTLSVYLSPMMSDGRLTACTLVFDHFQRDDLYLGGNFLKVSGSLGLMAGNNGIGFIMKAVANEFDPDTMASNAIDLSRIYLVGAKYKTNFDSMIASYPSDAPGGVFAAFELDPGTTMFLEAISAGTTTVAIGPKSGTSDIQLSLDLTVTATDEMGRRTHSEDTGMAFYECAERLITPMAQQ